MKYSSIAAEMEKIASIESAYEKLIKDYAGGGRKIISSPCFFIPPEINAAFNIVTLKIPEFILRGADFPQRAASLYDAVIIPEKECFCSNAVTSGISPYIFRTPPGFGEDAAVFLHNEISLMLKTVFDIELKSINIESLQRETSVYENLRRTVRNISALRGENRSLLSNAELSLIFETALILPPETAIGYITPLLEEMKKTGGGTDNPQLRGMLYGGKSIPSSIADDIEKNGILIAEDDSCTGRRLFDISLNAGSEYIFYEILDAYSYRPLTPCLRTAGERYELLYRLLRNYNIGTVIFYRDKNCAYSSDDIDFLSIRMMRDGIDPLVIDKNNYDQVIADYVSRIQ